MLFAGPLGCDPFTKSGRKGDGVMWGGGAEEEERGILVLMTFSTGEWTVKDLLECGKLGEWGTGAGEREGGREGSG